VLVLERIKGIKIDNLAALDDAGFDRHQIALNSARIIVKEVLEDGFFHADPHPGNLVIMPGEAIGAMDFGMVGRLSHQDRLNLIRLYAAAIQPRKSLGKLWLSPSGTTYAYRETCGF
jgi:ubiquinone biosynthesis protein